LKTAFEGPVAATLEPGASDKPGGVQQLAQEGRQTPSGKPAPLAEQSSAHLCITGHFSFNQVRSNRAKFVLLTLALHEVWIFNDTAWGQ
jgi:hypothetical protein